MPKRWREYSLRQKIRLQPFVHAIKQWRYRRVDRRYLESKSPLRYVLGPLRESITGTHLVSTITFNDRQAVRWQLALASEFLHESNLLVCDNSSSGAAADSIAKICDQQGVKYLRLPDNPWTGKNPSRSHGAAMNWVWHHLIRPARPKTFGFIDQDLYPIGPSTPHREIGECGCFGDKRWSGHRWFLWAGYCFFDFESVINQPLDFGLDWFAGLDTGGANWEVLYRHILSDSIPQRQLVRVAALRDVPLEKAYYERRGNHWIHEVGQDGVPELRLRKREVIRRLLRPYLKVGRAA